MLPSVDMENLTSASCSELLPTLAMFVPALSSSQLDKLISVMINEGLLVAAAVHPIGYFLAMRLVLHVMSTDHHMKTDVLMCLANDVESLQGDNWGKEVLRSLEGFI